MSYKNYTDNPESRYGGQSMKRRYNPIHLLLYGSSMSDILTHGSLGARDIF